MAKVIFTKNFAKLKKGDEFTCDAALASRLVRQDKVAKYSDEDLAAQAELIEKGKARQEVADAAAKKRLSTKKAKLKGADKATAIKQAEKNKATAEKLAAATAAAKDALTNGLKAAELALENMEENASADTRRRLEGAVTYATTQLEEFKAKFEEGDDAEKEIGNVNEDEAINLLGTTLEGAQAALDAATDETSAEDLGILEGAVEDAQKAIDSAVIKAEEKGGSFWEKMKNRFKLS